MLVGFLCSCCVGIEADTHILSLIGIMSGCYRYMQDLTEINSGCPRVANQSFVRGPTSLNLAVLSTYLDSHPDLQYASYVYHGILHGFLNDFCHGSCLRRSHGNHPSTDNNPSIIANYLREEVRISRLVGLVAHYFQQLLVHTSPTGLISEPRSDSWRLIVGLSSPWGQVLTRVFPLSHVLSNICRLMMRLASSGIWAPMLNWLTWTFPMLIELPKSIQMTNHF